MAEGYSPVEGGGKQRTEISCHNCKGDKVFIAILDYSINGNHKIVCPRCGHLHYRTIKDGKITEARWTAKAPEGETIPTETSDAWSPTVIKRECSVASSFLRDLWLQRSDVQI